VDVNASVVGREPIYVQNKQRTWEYKVGVGLPSLSQIIYIIAIIFPLSLIGFKLSQEEQCPAAEKITLYFCRFF